MGFSPLGKDILNAMSLQEALESHRNKEMGSFPKTHEASHFPTLSGYSRARETQVQAGGNGEMRRGEKADWSPIPPTQMQGTLTPQVFKIQFSSQRYSCFWKSAALEATGEPFSRVHSHLKYC